MARAVLKVTGGEKIGIGHVMRSVELAAAMSNCGITIAGFICNDDAWSRRVITDAGHPVWHESEYLSALTKTEADVLVIDHPGELHRLCSRAREVSPRLTIVALDYFDMERANGDVIVNLINHHPTLTAPCLDRVRYVEGPQYAIIRDEFARWRTKPREIAARVRKILITFGGADPHRRTSFVLSALQRACPREVLLEVVIGPRFAHRDEVERLARTSSRVHIHENARQIGQLMHDCDLAIAGGGTTMLELACIGTPAIILPQNEAEAHFSTLFAAHRAVTALPLKVSAAGLRSTVIEAVSDCSLRKRMSAAAKELVDGGGKLRIAELITESVASRN
jgi:spore coat polysaccharide biosynthesis predicted glycosyltransferase SpsG